MRLVQLPWPWPPPFFLFAFSIVEAPSGAAVPCIGIQATRYFSTFPSCWVTIGVFDKCEREEKKKTFTKGVGLCLDEYIISPLY